MKYLKSICGWKAAKAYAAKFITENAQVMQVNTYSYVVTISPVIETRYEGDLALGGIYKTTVAGWERAEKICEDRANHYWAALGSGYAIYELTPAQVQELRYRESAKQAE